MKTMRKLVVGVFLLFAVANVSAQASQECMVKYSLLKSNISAKKYTEAKTELQHLMNNCPKLSVNIYKYGRKLAKVTKDADLMKSVYEGQLLNFPDKNPAKVHDTYATFLIKNNLGTESQIQSLLEKAYSSPKDMSVKNIFRYFDGIFQANKDTNPQVVFDTYDNVLESIGEKLDYYSAKMAQLMEKETAGTASAKELRKLKAYRINSKALGHVQTGLDQKIETLATCDRLIPLLEKQFESKKSDEVWLRRSVSRLHHKECQSAPLYEKLARTYAEVSPSSTAYNFLAGVLEDKGDVAGASQMRQKAFDLETDPNKKAKLKLMEAFDAKRAGRKARARALAYEALKFNPNMGHAYLLIASMYQTSANSCGKDEFEKRMVYVAALNKARKAQAVDPACGAGRYISNYRKNIPSKTLIFEKGLKGGSSYKIGCWIGETVAVPNM